MLQTVKQTSQRPAIWLAWLAALLYCSWPLGYILNPALGRSALASQLEAPHQPYNWVFIAMDVLTGLVVLGVGILQITRTRLHRFSRFCVFGYMLFGVLVSIAALTPLNCDPAANTCGPLVHNPALILHGICSIFSVLFLLFSVMMLAISVYKHRGAWFGYFVFMLILGCWVVFGLGSLVAIWQHIHSNVLQDYFITVCSASVIVVISVIEYFHISQRYSLHNNSVQPFDPRTPLVENGSF